MYMKYQAGSYPLSSKGFTLLEVLIVLFVGVLLVSVAIPNMSGLVADSRRSSATTELLLSMNLARSEALKRHRHVTVCKSADGESCGDGSVAWSDGWIVFVNSSSANVSQRDNGEELVHVSPALGGDAEFDAEAGVADFAAFRPSGRATVAGSFVWCDKRGADDARGVFILPSGRAIVSDHTVAGEALSCSTGG
jgi:type IV fimbrial biogenesis protein FimT